MGYQMYKVIHSETARKDVDNLVAYMIYSLKNYQAASNFFNLYDKQISNLKIFPYAYRDIGYEYQGYKIHIKPFSTYNIFYVVDETTHQIIILRILKNRQDWRNIMYYVNDFSF